jgi:serine/threonine-protein kinase
VEAPVRIGRYEIIRRLGKGMTDVYLATDAAENRKVALKLIQPAPDRTTQLILEAERRGAAIQKELRGIDARVVEIYDFGDLEGYFFVAMQFVEGRNLAEVLRAEHNVEPQRAAAVALEICEQLAKFHACPSAVVHGDIKPSNIHIGWNDTVRLLDFGIARTLRTNGDATAHHFGSPGYCSPERLARSEVDSQSDIWAVGATLYEMLAGTPPFQAENTTRLERLIRSRRPPRALPSGCPRGLAAIVAKALAPEPAQRYRSARDFESDLRAFLEHRPTVAETERRRRWSPNATMEAAREYLRKATRTARRARRQLAVLRAMARATRPVAWFGAGMALWIGGSLAYEALVARPSKPPAPAVVIAKSVAPVKIETPDLYIAAADRILEAFRTSADPSLHDFDWRKAEVCLERAVELGSRDAALPGKLALCRGYASLERLNGESYDDLGATRLRRQARDQFEIAARELGQDPAPHLAMARLYVYSLPNVEKAMAEFAAAQLQGATMGRREIEQEADAYRIRAELGAGESPEVAWQDAQTARGLYERIRGFDLVDEHIAGLDRLQAAAARAKVRRSRRWR